MTNLSSIDISGSNYKYNLKLRKPDFTILADIDIKYVESLDLKFNDTSSVSSLNLKIPKFISDSKGNIINNTLYDLISNENRPLITLNDTDCFYIDDMDEVQTSDKDCVKTLTCYSREKMLSQRNVSLNDTLVRQIKSDTIDTSEGILDILHSELPSWSAGYLDPIAIKDNVSLGNKYRVLNGGSKVWFDFIKNECTLAYKSVFLFDSYNKKVNVYDESNIGNLIPLQLSLDNFIKKVNKKTKGSQIVTRLYVDGGSNQKSTDNASGVDISEYNPTGKTYIEDFTPYLNGMSSTLKSALTTYNAIVEEKNIEFLQIKIDINDLNAQILSINTTLTSLNEAMNAQKQLKIQYIKANDNIDLNSVTTEINRLQGLIDSNNTQLNTLNVQLTTKNNDISAIATYLEKATCKDSNGNLVFTNELISELDDFIVESNFSTDSYLTSQGLYERAKEELKSIQEGIIEFDIEVESFIDSIISANGETWDKVLTLGDYIMVDSIFGKLKLRLIELNHTPKKANNSPSLKLTFSNKPYKFVDFKLGDSVRQSSATRGTLNKNLKKWNDFKYGVDFSKDIMNNGLNLATAMVNGRSPNNKIQIDEYGEFLIDATDENNQLYLGASVIAMTKTGWLDSVTSITQDGVIGDTIVGRILVGQNLYIKTESNQVTIDQYGVNITGGALTVQDVTGKTVINGTGITATKLEATNVIINGGTISFKINGVEKALLNSTGNFIVNTLSASATNAGIDCTDLSSSRYINCNMINANGRVTSKGQVSGTSLYTAGQLDFGSGYGNSLYTNGYITVGGNLNVAGTKNCIQKTNSYGYRAFGAYELAENFLGDIGKNVTDSNGLCTINIDPIIIESVNTIDNYHVFLQKYGQGDLWVEEITENYFTIKGDPNLKFSWEIKAKRRGFEQIRLEQVTMQ